MVRKKDKNVKSVTNKTENLVDISDCKDFENFKFDTEKDIKKKEEKKIESEKKKSIIQYEVITEENQ